MTDWKGRTVEIIKCLVTGGTIHAEGLGNVVLDGAHRPCVVRKRVKGNGEVDQVLLVVDLDIPAFVDIARKMSDDHYADVVIQNKPLEEILGVEPDSPA